MAHLKCRDCFIQNFSQQPDVHVALAQSFDTVIVYAGDALCEEHLRLRVLGLRLVNSVDSTLEQAVAKASS